MKKILLSSIALLFAAILFAQTEPDTVTTELVIKDFTKGKMAKEDYFISDIFTDFWQNTPTSPDVLKPKTINRGYNAYFMNDNPIGNSNFSFAIGLGVSVHNMYSNCIPFEKRDSLNNPLGETEFVEIPGNIDYKKNKMTLFYGDIPLELRFRTKNSGDKFKIALGVKAGYLIQSHTKYIGDRLDNLKGTIKYKEFNIPNIEKLRYGVTARIGYGKFNISGYYALTSLFDKGKGPEDMFPISVGVAVTPF